MRPTLKSLVPALAASALLAALALLAACGSSSTKTAGSTATSTGGPGSKSTVATASNTKLGQTILVDSRGMTLYHLTAETKGRFICTAACLQVWHPLTVKPGVTPSGSTGSLAVVGRPDGTKQVTYRGIPLYTFASDRSPGEVSGQGIKDVGTWTPIAVGGTASTGGGTGGTPSGY